LAGVHYLEFEILTPEAACNNLLTKCVPKSVRAEQTFYEPQDSNSTKSSICQLGA
jgi:hypothetical protein